MQCVIFSWGVLICAFGLWVSSCNRRSMTASSFLFGTMLTGLAFIPLFCGMIDKSGTTSEIVGHFNPFSLISKIQLGGKHYEPAFMSPSIHWIYSYWGATLLYGFLTLIFLFFTYNQLKQLEEPKRR